MIRLSISYYENCVYNKKRLTLFLIFSKYIFLFSNLKFYLVYACILKKKQECIYKNTTKIYVLRHIFSVTLSFSYDSVKPKKNNNKHGLEKRRVLETGNFRFFDFLGFLSFFIKCLNALVKVTKCANQILM